MLWIGLFLLILSTALSVSWYTQHKGDIDAGVFSIKQLDVYFWLGALCGLASTAAFIFSLVSLTAPYQAPPVEETSPEAEPLPPLTDYVEISRNIEEYDGREVLVAGRISYTHPTNYAVFSFNERLGLPDDPSRFQISAYGDPPCNDKFEVGQYVLVRGTCKDGYYGPELYPADVISTGEDAREAYDRFMDPWNAVGIQDAETLPLMDYMDILESPEEFVGQRVRVAGKIARLNTSFYFLNRELSDGDDFYVSMDGCPAEMCDLIAPEEYVVVSGLYGAGAPRLSDCRVETVGGDAETAALALEEAWLERYQQRRDEFIASCETHSYDNLIHYPGKNRGCPILVSGYVLQVRNGKSLNVLLDIGSDHSVWVRFVGEHSRDPKLLKGDEITFYGECAGMNDWEDHESVPYVEARYSSVTEWYLP